jgi:hypothetical protein
MEILCVVYIELLWRAPELLREHVNPFALPTNAQGNSAVVTMLQRADVYSFSIILYELLGRHGPWGHCHMVAKEIVTRLANGELIRPQIQDMLSTLEEPQCSWSRTNEDEVALINPAVPPSGRQFDAQAISKCIEECWANGKFNGKHCRRLMHTTWIRLIVFRLISSL